jgi:hypothetical protein
MANFYFPPFDIKSEPSIEITTNDEGMIIRGQLDVLVLRDLLWVVAIEAKHAEFSLEAGRAQMVQFSRCAVKGRSGMAREGRQDKKREVG